MRLVQQKTTIPVPHIHGYATREHSPTGFAFMLIDYVDGNPLSSVSLSSMNEVKRTYLYEQLADVFIQLRLHEFPEVGSFSLSPDGSRWTHKRPLSIDLIEQEVEGLRPGLIVEQNQSYASTVDYVYSLTQLAFNRFERGRNSVYNVDAQLALYSLHQFRSLVVDWVDPTYNHGPFVLMHGDLRPSNIIVDKSLTIVGIVGWDWSGTVPVQLLVPPTWLTGRTLSGICRHFEREEYISELAKLREIVRAREGKFSTPKGNTLSEIWSRIEDDGSILIAGSLLRLTYIETIYSNYLDCGYSGGDLSGRAERFVAARQDRRDLVNKKLADRARYLEELEVHGITEEDSLVPTLGLLVQDKVINVHHLIVPEHGQLSTTSGIEKHPPPTVTRDPQASAHEVQADFTVQAPTLPAIQEVTGLHCNVCERDFANEGAVQMHLRSSKVHKKDLKRLKQRIALAGKAKNAPPLDSSATQSIINDSRNSFQHEQNRWSLIPAHEQPVILEILLGHCHSPEDLRRSQYRLGPYTAADIAGFDMCKNCRGLRGKMQDRGELPCSFHPGKLRTKDGKDGKDGPKCYSCCRRTGPGCTSLPAHAYKGGQRELVTRCQEFASTPSHSLQARKKCQAVALDCEMAGVKGATSEVVLLCAVDYLTGETLVNKLIKPSKRVVDWRTRVSGVTAEAMAAAIAQGQALDGWQEARQELWSHVDADTVLIGHSLQNDLDVLRVVHTRVVDSAILARNAAGGRRQWGLKSLCDELLGLEIQGYERKGHDCLEDTLAAREVVLWCTQNPQALEDWGRVKGEEEARKEEARREEAKKEKAKKAEAKEKEREESEKEKTSREER
ncbi:MAG: hypothetical protein M1839_003864 [Geoglossum umbratile]|nr:MAG: hypothetical protein M1839_003864 [Geoglossum umbratile]